MYYKFSGITQKLAGSAPAASCTPQGLKAGLPAEAPSLIFATPTKVVSEGGSVVEYMGTNRVPDFQRLYQTSDGVPIHLKRGVPDKLLYRTTMALTVGGVLYCLVALYIAAQPNKKWPTPSPDRRLSLLTTPTCRCCNPLSTCSLHLPLLCHLLGLFLDENLSVSGHLTSNYGNDV